MASSSRLSPDPALGVSDLMKPLKQWLEEEGKYDLLSLVEPKDTVTWKTAINVTWLCTLHGLFMKLLPVVPACIFASKKLKDALEKFQSQVKRLNYSKKHDPIFFDTCDRYIRQAAAQLRDLKNPIKYTTAMKKASIMEKQMIDEMVSLIQLPEEEPETRSPEPCTAIVPYMPPKPTGVTASPTLSSSSSPFPAGGNIFAKILAKKSSDEGPAPTPKELFPASSSGTQAGNVRSLKRQATEVDMTKSDLQMLADALAKDLLQPLWFFTF